VDLISGGRLGVGAGAAKEEVESLGLPFPSAGTRIAAVERVLDLLPRLFAGETVTEEPGPGRLNAFRLDPVPPQGAAVPLMVGANRDRLLALAARRANIVQSLGCTSQPQGRDYQNFLDTALASRIQHIRKHAGDRFDDIELSVLVQAAGTVVRPGSVTKLSRPASGTESPTSRCSRSAPKASTKSSPDWRPRRESFGRRPAAIRAKPGHTNGGKARGADGVPYTPGVHILPVYGCRWRAGLRASLNISETRVDHRLRAVASRREGPEPTLCGARPTRPLAAVCGHPGPGVHRWLRDGTTTAGPCRHAEMDQRNGHLVERRHPSSAVRSRRQQR